MAGSGFFISIQYLRAVAAILVVLFHITAIFPGALPLFDAGQAGVDIFFVISGLVMWLTGRQAGAGSFMLRRILRIVPLYWAVTLFAALISFSGGLSVGIDVPLVDLIRSLTFIAYENPGATPPVSPIVGPGWTLNLEMFFYLLFALALAWARVWLVPVMVLGLVGLALLGASLAPLGPVAGFYLQDIIVEFALGILLGRWITGGAWFPGAGLSGLILVAGLIWIFAGVMPSEYRLIGWGVGAVLIVTGVVGLESLLARAPQLWLKLLGDASYAIYLVHVITIGIVGRVWNGLGLTSGGLSDLVILAICLLAGITVHLLFEKPVGRVLRHWAGRGAGSHKPRID